MKKVKQMRGKKRMNLIFLIIMSGFIVYFAVTFIRQQEEISVIQSEMRALRHKIEQESKINKELLDQQSKANTNDFIEKIAREKLGMVREGERLFITVD